MKKIDFEIVEDLSFSVDDIISNINNDRALEDSQYELSEKIKKYNIDDNYEGYDLLSKISISPNPEKLKAYIKNYRGY